MEGNLNNKQLEKLADFTLDVGKAILIGTLALAATAPIPGKILTAFLGVIISIFLVKFSLGLLKDNDR